MQELHDLPLLPPEDGGPEDVVPLFAEEGASDWGAG